MGTQYHAWGTTRTYSYNTVRGHQARFWVGMSMKHCMGTKKKNCR